MYFAWIWKLARVAMDYKIDLFSKAIKRIVSKTELLGSFQYFGVHIEHYTLYTTPNFAWLYGVSHLHQVYNSVDKSSASNISQREREYKYNFWSFTGGCLTLSRYIHSGQVLSIVTWTTP